jgi:hypothetical protein
MSWTLIKMIFSPSIIIHNSHILYSPCLSEWYHLSYVIFYFETKCIIFFLIQLDIQDKKIELTKLKTDSLNKTIITF